METKLGKWYINFIYLLCSDGQGVSTSHSTDLSEMEERQDAGK